MRDAQTGRADSRHNREHILDTAAAVWESERDLTMHGLAERSGLARQTVYRHFADRDAVIDALITREAATFVPELLEGMAELDRRPLAESVVAFATAVVDRARARHALISLVSERLANVARDAVSDEPLARLLADLRASGHHDSPVPDAWLAAAIRALCLTAALDDGPREGVVHGLSTSLLQLLGLERPRP
ncbi:TetR/AcrR family transcriptional regulator [Nocardioidaceae bacterium]|nr:TetR/AcrR family transcriptional regulator [Nocardioidaceae bacterium]